MELVEQRIELPRAIRGASSLADRHTGSEGYAHRVNDVLPLGGIPNVHGIVSIWHHMYEAARGERGGGGFFACVNRQRSKGTN